MRSCHGATRGNRTLNISSLPKRRTTIVLVRRNLPGRDPSRVRVERTSLDSSVRQHNVRIERTLSLVDTIGIEPIAIALQVQFAPLEHGCPLVGACTPGFRPLSSRSVRVLPPFRSIDNRIAMLIASHSMPAFHRLTGVYPFLYLEGSNLRLATPSNIDSHAKRPGRSYGLSV